MYVSKRAKSKEWIKRRVLSEESSCVVSVKRSKRFPDSSTFPFVCCLRFSVKQRTKIFFSLIFRGNFSSTFFVVAVVCFFMTTKLRDILRNIYCEVSFARNELSFRQGRRAIEEGRDAGGGEWSCENLKLTRFHLSRLPVLFAVSLFSFVKGYIVLSARERRVCYAIRKTRVQSKALCYFDYSKHHKRVSSNWKTTTETRGNKKKLSKRSFTSSSQKLSWRKEGESWRYQDFNIHSELRDDNEREREIKSKEKGRHSHTKKALDCRAPYVAVFAPSHTHNFFPTTVVTLPKLNVLLSKKCYFEIMLWKLNYCSFARAALIANKVENVNFSTQQLCLFAFSFFFYYVDLKIVCLANTQHITLLPHNTNPSFNSDKIQSRSIA